MRFKPTESVAMTAAVVACIGAVISALIPALYTFTSRNRELDIRLVEIGIGILRADPKEKQTQGAREWAITVIEDFSGRKFSAQAKAELLDHKLDYSQPILGYGDVYGGGGYIDTRGDKQGPPRTNAPPAK